MIKLINLVSLKTDLPFKPTLENPDIAQDVFLVDCAFQKLKNGEFRHVPHILGYTDAEMLFYAPKNILNFFKGSSIKITFYRS